jgi:hypothetical protein
MKKIISIVFFLAFTISLHAQQSVNGSWQETPQVHVIVKQFESASAVGILDDRKIEYVVNDKEPYIRSTFHRIIKINDDKGIEMYNKIYIPVYRNGEISEIKARTITKTGKVIELPVEKIKEIQEDNRTFKLFAMEGVEKGAEVEYQYISKRPMAAFGTEVFQGSNIPYQTEYFTLISPEHLKFDVKGYNGFKIGSDTVIEGKRVVFGWDNNVEETNDEKYAVVNRYLRRVQYKISYNLSNSTARIYTWNDFAKRISTAYSTYTDKEEKALDTWMKQIDMRSAVTDEEKILQVEDFIKTNINIDEKIVGDDVDALDKVFKTRNTNRDGGVRLFAGLFDRLDIPYNIVFPSSRNEFPIDEELENWNGVEEIFFYFPKTGKFISPVSSDLRYPYVPPYYTAIKGLFLKSITVGSFKTATAVFREVPMEPFDQHAINMEVEVKFDETLDTLLINSKQILKGYGATSYRPIYTFLPKDKQDEANREIIKAIANSTNIYNIKTENTSFKDYFTNKPLIISGDIKSTELLERAGNKILFQLGEIIGPQEQMYQEKPRKFPAEMPYPHILERKIRFHIPEGYQVKNLSDINMNISFKFEGVETGFVSSYTQNGNTIDIIVVEAYRTMEYPLSEFENFKKVINAAADFNKIVLVLEKK